MRKSNQFSVCIDAGALSSFPHIELDNGISSYDATMAHIHYGKTGLNGPVTDSDSRKKQFPTGSLPKRPVI